MRFPILELRVPLQVVWFAVKVLSLCVCPVAARAVCVKPACWKVVCVLTTARICSQGYALSKWFSFCTFMILVLGPLWTWCVPPVKGKMSQVES